MKKRIFPLLIAGSLLLSGCSWLDGSYVSVETHHEQRQEEQTEIISASNYLELMDAMEELITAGAETGVIHVPNYENGSLEAGMSIAAAYAMKNSPIGAYAVEEIHYELGTSSGLPAVAVSITYRHSLAEIQRIRHVADVAEAEQTIAKTLDDCAASVVLMIDNYTQKDFVQVVEDYAASHPASVMETPQVAEGIYGTGESRVVELIFTYQNSRDTLRQMKAQVEPVFNSAVLYVSGDGAQRQKFSQLYAFLMERFDYKQETSITPAYSLLRHGVGDSRAFATVYAAMCRDAGLECIVITGTRSGEPWTWNMVLDNGRYYHVDLLRCNSQGYFQEWTDGEMSGYVWDYSAYPSSADLVTPDATEETQLPEETAAAETEWQAEEMRPQEPSETTESMDPVPGPEEETEPSEEAVPAVPETASEAGKEKFE